MGFPAQAGTAASGKWAHVWNWCESAQLAQHAHVDGGPSMMAFTSPQSTVGMRCGHVASTWQARAAAKAGFSLAAKGTYG